MKGACRIAMPRADICSFVQGGTLQALAFDLDTLETAGQPVQLAEGLFRYAVDGFAAFDVSAAGLLAYRVGGEAYQRRLIWSDRQGNIRPAIDVIAGFSSLALSPDGSRLAVQQPAPNGPLQIVVFDLGGGLRTPLTSRGDNVNPVFSPDATIVVFAQADSGGYQLMRVPVDGSAPPAAFRATGERLRAAPRLLAGWSVLHLRCTAPDHGVPELCAGSRRRRLTTEADRSGRGPDASPGHLAGRAMGLLFQRCEWPGRALHQAFRRTRRGEPDHQRRWFCVPKWNPTGNGEIFYTNGKRAHVHRSGHAGSVADQPTSDSVCSTSRECCRLSKTPVTMSGRTATLSSS